MTDYHKHQLIALIEKWNAPMEPIMLADEQYTFKLEVNLVRRLCANELAKALTIIFMEEEIRGEKKKQLSLLHDVDNKIKDTIK